MNRWNGWGDINVSYPLAPSAEAYLAGLVGAGLDLTDATLADVLASIPPSRLPHHALIEDEPEVRLRHARGHSLPDWIALRSNQVENFPDGVAFPTDDEQVRQLIQFTLRNGVRLIPYGGGTSVVGHINPLPGEAPVLTVDLSRMNKLLAWEPEDGLATFQAGINGVELEKQLNLRGYRLGHYPQSFELSTLGGWIATRSSGQQSYYYGRIEDLFAGGRLETPLGTCALPALPASAAGPDLRHVILGSEGRLGILTNAQVRVRRLPEYETFYGAFFHEWQPGISTLQALAQEHSCLSMLRLSDADETAATLAQAGKSRLVSLAQNGLDLLKFGPERCLLVFGITGEESLARQTLRWVKSEIRKGAGMYTGQVAGKVWRKTRFLTPYLRNTLWEKGYALDTLETALPWSIIQPAALEIKSTIRNCCESFGERLLVFAHISSVYTDGASLYVTYLFRRASTAQDTYQRWSALKSAASQVILRRGGTISHQHGVGIDHAAYLGVEKGEQGMGMLNAILQSIDPGGMMNPGKLLP